MIFPAIAASASRRSGIATAANTSALSFAATASNPRPSEEIRCAFAKMPPNVARSELPIEPENAIRMSVAPAMMNQVETS